MSSRYEWVKKSVDAKRKWVIELKESGRCFDCNEKYPHYVMDYDHRDPSTKKFGISAGSFRESRKAIELEIAKCDLVCSNCHRQRTYEQRLL